MKKATIQLETLACPSCVQKIENTVRSFNGIEEESIKILFNASKVRFDFDEAKLALTDVEKAITKLGYQVIKIQERKK
ncbi:MAG: heavy-metal-associated domain-containing protein [Saccharofermentanales bacterium]|jgi:copper chaperone